MSEAPAWRQRARSLLVTVGGAIILCSLPGALHATEARELVVGPVRLEARTMGWNYHEPFHHALPVEFADDLWVIGSDVALEDGEGNPLPRQLLCHSLLHELRDDRRSIVRFRLGWSGERTLTRFPEGTGVLLRAGQPYQWETMFQNPYDLTYPEVYLRITLAVEPSGAASPRREALDVMAVCIGGCKGHTMAFPAPPGQSARRDEVRFPSAGRIVVMTAHLHRYGRRLTLEALGSSVEQTPRLVWEAKPIGDPTGEFRTPHWAPASAWRVTPHERFRLTAEYDNPTDQDWPAMGLMIAYFVPEGSSDLSAQTRQAITKAVDFLAQAQQPDGSFLLWGCKDEALTDCQRAYSTVSRQQTPDSPVLASQATAVALAGLLAVAGEDPRTTPVLAKGARWLAAQMDSEGLFGHFRMAKPEVGPQCPGEFRSFGATAVNRAVLEDLSVPLSPTMPDLATYQRSDGTFYHLVGYRFHFAPSEVPAIKAGGSAQEWFKKQYAPLMRTYESPIFRRIDVVDPITNAQMFDYLVQHGHIPPELCDYLVRAAQQERPPGHPAFIRSPYLLPYTLSQAYAHGATCLEPITTTLRSRLLSQQRPDGSWGGVLDTALAASSLMAFGYDGPAVDRAIQFLLQAQQPDGSWERETWLVMLEWVYVRLASEELSTGYVLEALGKHLTIRQKTTL